MANDISGRPWVLDTPGTSIIWPFWTKVDHFEFADYNLDTDTVFLTDINGKRVWDNNGASDLRSLVSQKIDWIQGLKMPTLTAGRVFVYIH